MAAWTSMLAFVAVFKAKFGADILLTMNTLYFLPGFPMLVLTISYIPAWDRWMGHRLGLLVRVGTCMSVLAVSVALFPTLAEPLGKTWLQIACVLIGVFGGLGYGSMMQFNARFPTVASAILAMGVFSPGFIFMFFQLAAGMSAPPFTPTQAKLHWYIATVLVILGLVAFVALLFSEDGTAVCDAMDAEARKAAAASDPSAGARLQSHTSSDEGNQQSTLQNPLSTATGAAEGIELPDAKKPKPAAGHGAAAKTDQEEASPMKAVLTAAWPSFLSIVLSIFAVVTMTSFFTLVPTDNPGLPQTLFYVKNSFDFLGRATTLMPHVITTQPLLLGVVSGRMIFLPLFMLYVFSVFGESNAFVVILVAVEAIMAGHLNTMCFIMASKSVDKAHKSTAAGLLNIAFQTAILVSIGTSFAIVQGTDIADDPAAAEVAGNSTRLLL